MRGSDRAEEILEALWIATEEKGELAVSFDHLNIGPGDEGLTELGRYAFVEVKGERVYLRSEGREEARMSIRRHRLAERLMMDVLDVKGDTAEEKACEFEHLLREGVDTKLCTLLNHPTTCPHGKPIPPGVCCEEAQTSGEVGVVSLTELKAGEEGEIAYLAADDSKKMQKMMSMGVLPGNRFVLRQSYPSYVFRIGHSEFAVDSGLARDIFVRKTNS
jgi:DtxR family Mn-dependent transcriptional regulator